MQATQRSLEQKLRDARRSELDAHRRVLDLEEELASEKEKERCRVLDSIASTKELERLEEAAGIRDPSPPAPPAGTNATVALEPSPSEPLSDLGWSQADPLDSFDPPLLFDLSEFLADYPEDAAGGILSPIRCSS